MYSRALLLLVLTLGGCAVSGSIPDWVSDDAAGPEPVNYRFVVANALDAIMGPKFRENRLLEISSPHRVDTRRGATWLVCIKSLTFPSRQPRAYYAAFLQRGKIVEYRLSVGIDQCELESYTPFEWSIDANTPVLQ
jgi:hypothetical protein